uniref:BED-type domain-containing protein n=1 Tax=Setaria viridis TaxID=4556 RepID=A0A4U6T6K0_SETVI|nr:hypothetical protein SEVIR_9G452850v2 [Setaria viridis]
MADYPTCYNDELRLMGETGDDESDLEADPRELVNISVPDANGQPGGGDLQPPAASVGGETGTGMESTGSKRSRSCTSKVWDDFETLYKVKSGKRVRTGARCVHCKKLYYGISSSGTGHFHRHLPRYLVLQGATRMAQSQLKYNPDGSLHL